MGAVRDSFDIEIELDRPCETKPSNGQPEQRFSLTAFGIKRQIMTVKTWFGKVCECDQ